MKIIIHPFARRLRNGNENPKNYPYWEELIELLKDNEIIQVGEIGEKQLVNDFRINLSIDDLRKLINNSDTWISIDSFFQHLAWSENKPGIVIFSQSDPNIFGHKENNNIVIPKYIRQNQFATWEECSYIKEAFVKPLTIFDIFNNININKDK